MADVFFDNPPVLQGDEKTKLNQLKNYLNTISNKLNEALMTLSVDEISALAAERVQEAQRRIANQQETTENQQNAYNTLRSMIIKTAQIVRHEMDVIQVKLNDDINAVSDEVGELNEHLEQTITATATGVLQSFGYEGRIQTLEGNVLDTDSFIENTNRYIFTGILDETTMETGIAIGEGVTKEDGRLDNNNKCATFTMDEMAFWQGATKVAYFSSGKFYINNGDIVNSLTIGNFMWKKIEGGSMALVAT